MMAGSPDNGQYVQDHVLNIDEETRMYPDSTNDSDAFLSSETSQHALHSDDDRLQVAAVQNSLAGDMTGSDGKSFSALSFIASEYGESELSPCSLANVSSSPENTLKCSTCPSLAGIATDDSAYAVNSVPVSLCGSGDELCTTILAPSSALDAKAKLSMINSVSQSSCPGLVGEVTSNLPSCSIPADDDIIPEIIGGALSVEELVQPESMTFDVDDHQVMSGSHESDCIAYFKTVDFSDGKAASLLHFDSEVSGNLVANNMQHVHDQTSEITDKSSFELMQMEPSESDEQIIDEHNDMYDRGHNLHAQFQSSSIDGFQNAADNVTEDQCDLSDEIKEDNVVLSDDVTSCSMPAADEKLIECGSSFLSSMDDSSLSNSVTDKPTCSKRPRRNSLIGVQDFLPEEDKGLHLFPAERLYEYLWPQDGGEWHLLQEQISEFLGVLSFKHKHPDLTRRTCDKVEKDFIMEKGAVTETQRDLGLTALRSEEVYDLLMKDYPDKYHEYAKVLHEREKQKIRISHKEYQLAQPKLDKIKLSLYMKKAAKSAADYNRLLLRERREERAAHFDLQTYRIHFPQGRYKKLPPECTKVSVYPAAMMAGQFQDHYCRYTSDEMRYLPLQTVLYDPPKMMKNILAEPVPTSDSSSDDNEEKSCSPSHSVENGDSGHVDAANAPSVTGQLVPSSQPTEIVGINTTPVVCLDDVQGRLVKRLSKAGRPIGRPRLSSLAFRGRRRRRFNRVKRKVTITKVPNEILCPPAAEKMAKLEEECNEAVTRCYVCKAILLNQSKGKRTDGRLMKCSVCGRTAHSSCLRLSERMVRMIHTYPWQCMECKTCVKCMDPYDEDKMLFCDQCDRGYHTFCVGLQSLPTGRWECESCRGASSDRSKLG